ncbi:MAG TPA: hypothetical protein PLD37_10390, partial [Usitatibacteraceae bacterium]|nr:hypothetical protein [Usitatibacteraceae bacterium]
MAAESPAYRGFRALKFSQNGFNPSEGSAMDTCTHTDPATVEPAATAVSQAIARLESEARA